MISANSRPGVQAVELERRIMYSVVPGAELLADVSLSGAEASSAIEISADGGVAGSQNDDLNDSSQSGSGSISESNQLTVAARVDDQLDALLQAFENPEENAELIVVDRSIADYEALIEELENNNPDKYFVYLLDNNLDGVSQVTELLDQHSDLAAVHLISHGGSGEIQLGNSVINSSNLSAYSEQFSTWKGSFKADADMFLYGCDVAATEDGQEFVARLSELVELDLAASDDLTGDELLGGDWDLEFQTGGMEDYSIRLHESFEWEHLLRLSLTEPVTTEPTSITEPAVSTESTETDPLSSKLDPSGITNPIDDDLNVTLINDLNGDGLLNRAESNGPIEYLISLPGAATAGDRLEINDFNYVLTDDDIRLGKVIGTLTAPDHDELIRLRVTWIDGDGNRIVDSTELKVDLEAPQPNELIQNSLDSVEIVNPEFAPLFRLPAGTGNPGDLVALFSDSTEIGRARFDMDGSAEVALSRSGLTIQKISYSLTDAAGNEGARSSLFTVEFVDSELAKANRALSTIEVGITNSQSSARLVQNIQIAAGAPSGLERIESNQPTETNQARYTTTQSISVTQSVDTGFQNDFRSAYFDTEFQRMSKSQVEDELAIGERAIISLDNQDTWIELDQQGNITIQTPIVPDFDASGWAGNASFVQVDESSFWEKVGTPHVVFAACWLATSIPVLSKVNWWALLSRSTVDKETLAQIAKGKAE